MNNEVIEVKETEEELQQIIEELACLKEKLPGVDMRSLSVKCKRDINTLRQYLNGNIRDINFAARFLAICRNYVAINEQKEKLEF